MVEMKTTLAAVCMKVEHDKAKNIEKHLEFIEEAAEEEARLIVFPECALQGYKWTWDADERRWLDDEEQHKYFLADSETIPGPTLKIMAKQASRHNMLIQIGLAEKVEKNGEYILFNSIALIGPEGLIGVFRKVHMTPSPIFRAGDKFSVFNTMIGKIGPIICADLAYPESVRVLALNGADIITMSTAWGNSRLIPSMDLDDRLWSISGYFSGYKYDLLGKAASLENGVWMVIADQVGSSRGSEVACFGHSRIIDPLGRIVAGIGYKEGLVTAKVNIKAGIDPHRFRGRRPECYKILSDVLKT